MKSALMIILAALAFSTSAFAGTARLLDQGEMAIAQEELNKSANMLATLATCIITTRLAVECELSADGVGAEYAIFGDVVLKDGKIASLKFKSF